MNKSKAKGTTAETAVVNFLKEKGFRAHRKTLTGSADCGDIDVELNLVTIEVKNEQKMTLSEYVDEMNAEVKNANSPYGAVWHKRRGKGSPGEWYVTMDGNMYTKMLELLWKEA